MYCLVVIVACLAVVNALYQFPKPPSNSRAVSYDFDKNYDASILLNYLAQVKYADEPNQTTSKPSSYPQQPSSYPQQPSSYPQQPSSYPQQPSSYPQQPSSYPQQPSSYPQQPSSYPQQPSSYPQQPSSYPQQPSSYPQQPSSYPQQPSSYPQQPSSYPQQPSSYPQNPSDDQDYDYQTLGLYSPGAYRCDYASNGKKYEITGVCFAFMHCVNGQVFYRQCSDGQKFDQYSNSCVTATQCTTACPKGWEAHPTDPTKFLLGGYEMSCPEYTYFDYKICSCQWTYLMPRRY